MSEDETIIREHGGYKIRSKHGSILLGKIKQDLCWYEGDRLKIFVLESGKLIIENQTDPDILADREPETWEEKVKAARARARVYPPVRGRIQQQFLVAVQKPVKELGWEIGDPVNIRREKENTISIKNLTTIPVLMDRVKELKRKDELIAPRRGALTVKKKGDGAASTRAVNSIRHKSLADEQRRHQRAAEKRHAEKVAKNADTS